MRYEAQTRGQSFYALDANLRDSLARSMPGELARWDETLAAFGAWVGDAVDGAAAYTDSRGRPALEPFDRDGERVNRIRTNPAWDAVSRQAYERGVVGLNYGADPAPFTITFVMGYLISQADVSLHCPVAMSGAVAYVLDRFAPEDVKAAYLPELVRTDGNALSGGTWATELGGGSDLGATTTTARTEGDHVALNGLKWFASNPDGGLALVTARPEGAQAGPRGLGLYLVPLRLDAGRRNPMIFRRLKDKLGTRGIATAEIELTDTWATEVAAPPMGLKLMMEALGFSRLHNAFAAAGLQRRAFLEAMSCCANRTAFGERLTEMPMVQDEILKIMVPLEAGLGLALEAARAFDAGHADPRADPSWLRLLIALAKYRTAEDANNACRTAIEVMGGNAYTDDYVTPRLLRDAQVMTVWEGPANIQALDVIHAIGGAGAGLARFPRTHRGNRGRGAGGAWRGCGGGGQGARRVRRRGRIRDGRARARTPPRAPANGADGRYALGGIVIGGGRPRPRRRRRTQGGRGTALRRGAAGAAAAPRHRRGGRGSSPDFRRADGL